MKIDFTRGAASKNWSFKLGADLVEEVLSTRLLGVIINSQLTWQDHVDSVTAKCSKRLWALRSLKSLGFPKDELVLFYKASIRSVLEYASPLWSSGLTQ